MEQHLLLWSYWEPLMLLLYFPVCYLFSLGMTAGLVRLWNRTWIRRNANLFWGVTLLVSLPPAAVAMNAYTADYALQTQGESLKSQPAALTARDIMRFIQSKAASLHDPDKAPDELYAALYDEYRRQKIKLGWNWSLRTYNPPLNNQNVRKLLRQVAQRPDSHAEITRLFNDKEICRELINSLETALVHQTVTENQSAFRTVAKSSAARWWACCFLCWGSFLSALAVSDIKRIYPMSR